MAALLVSLHVAPNAKVLSAALVLAFVRLLARMRICVDFKRTWPGEGLIAGRADVPFLGGRVCIGGRRGKVVVVLVLPCRRRLRDCMWRGIDGVRRRRKVAG